MSRFATYKKKIYINIYYSQTKLPVIRQLSWKKNVRKLLFWKEILFRLFDSFAKVHTTIEYFSVGSVSL